MKIKTRFITSIFIVLITVLAVISKLLPHTIGDYIFDIFIIVLTLVAASEICNIMEKTNRKVNKLLTIFYIVFNYIILLLCNNSLNYHTTFLIQVVALVGYFLIILAVESLSKRNEPSENHLKTAANSIVACIYPSFIFSLILLVNHIDLHIGAEYASLMFVALILAITWLTDTFAYLVGCTVKGPKLAPKISPNKTISGAIGGLIGGVSGSMIIFAIMANVAPLNLILEMCNLGWWQFILIGLIGSVLGQIGDLFESKLKRNANIKDTGTLFPGHGGMLDRIDAMIFVTLFVFVVLILI